MEDHMFANTASQQTGMTDSALQDIHFLQKTDLAGAAALMLKFLREELQLPFAVTSVELRPSAVSLNSINGFLKTADGTRYFFKTHVEPNSIVKEYYNSGLLTEAGYPIRAPIFSSTDYGKQLLVYEYIDAINVFDAVRGIELGKRNDGAELLAVRQASDKKLAELYATSLRQVDAKTHAEQPIHQLFRLRLEGPPYRLRGFYDGAFTLPGQELKFADLAALQWTVNGVTYHGTLQDTINKAGAALHFTNQPQIWAVAGHGDAHAGNLFYFGPGKPLTYFDPAFAGTHSPLLDIIKPLIHDSFLKWLYFPDEIAAQIKISYDIKDGKIEVASDFQVSDLRRALFASKLENTLRPTLQLLREKDGLPETWQDIVQAAAMCCPLLTMNLSERQKFKPEIALLGLATAVELGGNSQNPQKPGWFEQVLRSALP
jgi:hypothetical protein